VSRFLLFNCGQEQESRTPTMNHHTLLFLILFVCVNGVYKFADHTFTIGQALADESKAEPKADKEKEKGPTCEEVDVKALNLLDVPLVLESPQIADEYRKYCQSSKYDIFCSTVNDCISKGVESISCSALTDVCAAIAEPEQKTDIKLVGPCFFPCAMYRTVNACEKACEIHGQGCRELGIIYRWAVGVKKDTKKAIKAWERGCDLGESLSCTWAGQEVGWGVDADKKKSMELLSRGCKEGEGDPIGCTEIAQVIGFSKNPSKKDLERRLFLLRKSCDKGFGSACNALGLSYLWRQGVERDEKHAFVLFRRACGATGQYNEIAEGCMNLSRAYGCCNEARKDACLAALAHKVGCNKGDHRCCNMMGWAYIKGTIVERDESKAFNLFEQACKNGVDQGCMSVADSYDSGYYVMKNVEEARSIRKGLCTKGNNYACDQAGLDLVRGRIKDEMLEAFDFFKQACERGYLRSCMNLVRMHANGNGVPKNEKKAAELCRKNCEAGDPEGCFWLGRSAMHARGQKRNYGLAISSFRKACNKKHARACGQLAMLLSHGLGGQIKEGELAKINRDACAYSKKPGKHCFFNSITQLYGIDTPKDRPNAIKTLSDSCDSGVAVGCFLCGLFFFDNPKKSEDFLNRAYKKLLSNCDKKIGPACSMVATMLSRGRGVSADKTKEAHYHKLARTLLDDYCRKGNHFDCGYLGWIYLRGWGIEPDLAKAERLFRKACDGGLVAHCSVIAELHELGLVVKKDFKKAFSIYEKACSHGSAFGCTRLGKMYELGRGTKKNTKKALELYRSACRQGSGFGCAMYTIAIDGPAKINESQCAENPTDCWKLGTQIMFSRNDKFEWDRGGALLRTACKKGEWRACHMLLYYEDLP
jgi:TPR repeat protein